MNSVEQRWLRIKRWDEHDLGGLHEAERNADLQWLEHYRQGRYAQAGEGWYIAGARYMAKIDSRLPPYWDSGKTAEEAAREIVLFLDCPVVRRQFAKLRESPKNEREFLATADFEILKSAYTPNFSKASGDNKRKLAAIYAAPGTPYKDD